MADTDYAIIKFNARDNPIFKNAEQADLSVEEIKSIDKIIFNCIDNYNAEQKKIIADHAKTDTRLPGYPYNIDDLVIDPTKYKRQYIPTINAKGEKEVWINFFCNYDDRDWKKEIILVMDGGNCYFQLKINLTTKKYFDFYVNGNG